MPLLDHFHSPLCPRRHWDSFFVTWAGTIADALNTALLPKGYYSEEYARIGARTEPGDVTQTDEFEVRVYEAEGGARLVAALELVSPANKDRESHRRAFTTKCAGYLAQGIAVIVVDVVTSRSGNLHADILRLLDRPTDTSLPDGTELYAVAYRPVVRDGAEVIEIWPEPLAVGRELPTLPLALNAEMCLPIDLESTYTAACARRRLE
ncbi:hypothetical protein VT84_05620 [Gemmata sp. SH-PL17]|uniref:hypothetical protein n=1 Tax=Gemmata sp. SH-PL17 TaxID=1630693 RepID=UPI00078BC41B|nr:hypothetical protein [Gemmata sp. SH-PL17]AMV23871.1 hypothetical protein VT84_05620 [Gemmata sp. SH-PL17]